MSSEQQTKTRHGCNTQYRVPTILPMKNLRLFQDFLGPNYFPRLSMAWKIKAKQFRTVQETRKPW